MKILKFVRFAFIGWIAGILFTALIGLVWPAIFPGIVHSDHYYDGLAISLSSTIVFTMFISSLPALIGGLIGGILPREGGRNEQLLAAAIGGIVLSIPFSCFNFWMLSGA